MGSLIGHVAVGFFFVIIGLWHLYNNIKLHLLHPSTFRSLPWFPTAKFRYLEPLFIFLAAFVNLVNEFFVIPSKHHLLDADGTIPFNHLRYFEHSSIYMSFLVYAVFAVLLDRSEPKISFGLTELLGALAFGQQLLNLRFHSTDQMGVEGRYHMLVLPLICVSFATTLLSIGRPNSFMVSFVRSASLLFQGAWFTVMGVMLWTPGLIAKGCFINNDASSPRMVHCTGDEALYRAKSLVNIQFSWFLIGMASGVMCMYLVMVKQFAETAGYWTLKRDNLEDLPANEGVGCPREDDFKKGSIQMHGFNGP